MVIPAVNARNEDEAERQFRILNAFANLIHLDIADGKFTPNKTWGSPKELNDLFDQTGLGGRVEVHLMVEQPEAIVGEWFATGLVERVIVHVEAVKDMQLILNIAKDYGGEVMLAAAPDTPVERLAAHKETIPLFQLLGVHPGIAGQEMQLEIINKVRVLKGAAPHATIEIDGGVNAETGKAAKAAGADILVSASYILNAPDPKKAYDTLAFL